MKKLSLYVFLQLTNHPETRGVSTGYSEKRIAEQASSGMQQAAKDSK